MCGWKMWNDADGIAQDRKKKEKEWNRKVLGKESSLREIEKKNGKKLIKLVEIRTGYQ